MEGSEQNAHLLYNYGQHNYIDTNLSKHLTRVTEPDIQRVAASLVDCRIKREYRVATYS